MSLNIQLEHLKESFLNLLFPPRCVGCGKEGGFLCPSCSQLLPRIVPPYCVQCGIPVQNGTLCPSCQSSPLTIDSIRSLFLFEGVARDAIHHLKYKNLKAIASPLGQFMGEYLRASSVPADVLVPVPLHSRQLRERGYNQSTLLARETGRLVNLPVVETSLLRLRNTISQARTSSAQERRRNVDRAFGCSDQTLQNKRVVIIDDVCTTSATLDSCAVALKAAGATSVWGLTVARER